MSNEFTPGQIPSDVEARLGASLGGWTHLTRAVSQAMPTALHRANLVRRGAVAQIPKLPRSRH